MRAVRARRAAWLARGLGLLAFLPRGLVAFLPAGAAVESGSASFFVPGFSLEEAELAAAFAGFSDGCPAIGCTIMNTESRPTKQRAACRETEVGESATFILPL
jgi:hypothetical protein